MSQHDPLPALLSHLPAGYRPGRAPGWEARIHWQVAGGADHTLVVQGDACHVAPGLEGEASCRIRIHHDTLRAILDGSLDATEAFMTGQALADDMTDVLMLSEAFNLQAVAASLRGEAGPRSWPLDRVWDGGTVRVIAEPMRAFAQATDWPLDQLRAAPPLYHARLIRHLVYRVATDPEVDLDIQNMAYRAYGCTLLHPLAPGDELALSAHLEASGPGRDPADLVAVFSGKVRGKLAFEARAVLDTRSSDPERDDVPLRASYRQKPDYQLALHIAADQSHRYARASLDDNPVHFDEATARAAGLPGLVLQASCLLAMTCSTLARELPDCGAGRVANLMARFGPPARNGSLLQVRGWESDGVVDVETLDLASQRVHLFARLQLR